MIQPIGRILLPFFLSRRLVKTVLILVLLMANGQAAVAEITGKELNQLAPRANPVMLDAALKAIRCASKTNPASSDILTVIDYGRPSLEPRLWVFDLKHSKLLMEELVGHGKFTGENYAVHFSNEAESKKSSLGLFVTADTYIGENGYTLRLHGLEPGFNDRALERLIVLHGAPYISAEFGKRQGRLGRSWGCPVVRTSVAKALIDTIKGGRFLFIYYPQKEWLKNSRYLHCK